jgi:hypothetical protein
MRSLPTLLPFFKERVDQHRNIEADQKSPHDAIPLRSLESSLPRKLRNYLAANGKGRPKYVERPTGLRDYPPPAGAVKPQGPVPYEENERRWQRDCRPPSSNIHDGNQGRGGTPSTKTGAVQLASDFRKLEPLRSHLSEDGARFAIGRNLRQLQAMGGEVDVLLSFVD